MDDRTFCEIQRTLKIEPNDTFREVYAQFAMSTYDELVSHGVRPAKFLRAMTAASDRIGLLSDDLRRTLDSLVGEFVNSSDKIDRQFFELCHDRFIALLRPLTEEPKARTITFKSVS